MVLYLPGSYIPVERALPNSTTTDTTTDSLSSSNINLSGDGPSNVGPSVVSTSLPPSTSTSPNPNLLSSSTSNLSTSSTGSRSSSSQLSTSSTGSQSNTEASSVFQVPTSSQSFPFSTEAHLSGTTSGPIVSQSSSYPSDAGNGYLQETITPSLPISIGPSPSFSLTSPSLSSPSLSTSSESTTISTMPSSSTPSSSPSTSSSHSSSSGSSYLISTHKILTSSSTTSGSLSSSTVTIIPASTLLHSSFPVTETSTSTVSFTSTITTISSVAYSFSSSYTASTSSFSTVTSTTITVVPSTFFASTVTPWASTLTLTSVLPNAGTTTLMTTTTGVLSTVGVGNTANRLSNSPGSIAGLALGILGVIAFASLLLFCARRRRRQLNRDASAIPPWASGGPLEAEIDTEEPYAGILAALNAGMGAGRDAHIEGDTSGEVSGEFAIPHASSPILPLYSLPGEGYNDGLYVFPLSPPPAAHIPAPPPSAYVPLASSEGQRRRSSPGPDAAAWLGGYNVAPASSVTSHHSHSTTNILTRTETGTRTRTGSEEPLLTRAGSGSSSYLDSGNKIRLGSAFGSPKESMNGYNIAPTSPSWGRRSNTVSSFGALRSVSSRGAMRSTSSHGYEFGFGSASSGGGSHRGPALGLAISGAPKSYMSKRAMKWKKRKRESTGSSTSASAYSSTDEKPAGVRAILGRLRLRNTSSPKSNSSRDLESDKANEKRNSDAHGLHTSPRTFSAVLSPATPPLEPVPIPTSPRFVLSNPDPQPHSPYVKVDAEGALQGHANGLRPPTWLWHGQAQANLLPPSPAFTLESRISAADGLLDPRLRETAEGRSNTSLRDFEDYSRPIGGLVHNRMHSTTTFGTVDSQDGASMRDREDDQGEETCVAAAPRASWVVDGVEDGFHAY